MRIQHSSKDRKTCVLCDNTIQRSETRKVDGSMHRHLTCPPKKKVKPVKSQSTLMQKLALWLAK